MIYFKKHSQEKSRTRTGMKPSEVMCFGQSLSSSCGATVNLPFVPSQDKRAGLVCAHRPSLVMGAPGAHAQTHWTLTHLGEGAPINLLAACEQGHRQPPKEAKHLESEVGRATETVRGPWPPGRTPSESSGGGSSFYCPFTYEAIEV